MNKLYNYKNFPVGKLTSPNQCYNLKFYDTKREYRKGRFPGLRPAGPCRLRGVRTWKERFMHQNEDKRTERKGGQKKPITLQFFLRVSLSLNDPERQMWSKWEHECCSVSSPLSRRCENNIFWLKSWGSQIKNLKYFMATAKFLNEWYKLWFSL